jgi:hypothetical protein
MPLEIVTVFDSGTDGPNASIPSAYVPGEHSTECRRSRGGQMSAGASGGSVCADAPTRSGLGTVPRQTLG